jgi:hypothetical protein
MTSLPTAPTTVQQVIPSYLYWQYNDDVDLQAFVASYNTLAQQILNTFNALNLPIYTSDLIVGPVLDWVAKGIYGVDRPVLSFSNLKVVGGYDSTPYDTVPYDTLKSLGSVTTIATSDDIFKRILTWNLYKGDGRIFNPAWLKRRVLRFLNGLNGTDPGIDQTYLISVTYGGSRAITIDLTAYIASQPSSQLPTIFQAALQSQALNLPFQYTYTVTL